MEANVYRIPRYLDEPDKIFFLYTDELLLGVMAFLLLSLLIHWFVGCVGLIFSIRLKRKLRRTPWANLFESFLYWHFPSKNLFKKLPPSFIREYV